VSCCVSTTGVWRRVFYRFNAELPLTLSSRGCRRRALQTHQAGITDPSRTGCIFAQVRNAVPVTPASVWHLC
jgi:hypothetical protein